MITEPNYIEVVASELKLKPFQVETVLELIKEWATVPFIARYRKERTWNLDEDNIRDIIELKNKTENLYKAKVTAINWIEELWMMTEELMENILKAKTLKEVEEIYKPYKSKKKTKAMLAIEKWFQVVADSIKQNWEIIISEDLLKEYSKEEILEWSVHIISAEISSNAELRDELREYILNKWIIKSKFKTKSSLDKLNEKDRWQISKFELYSDFDWQIRNLKPYQILALNRWEKLWILNVKIEKSEDELDLLKSKYAEILNISINFIALLLEAFTDWYNTLFKSVENEVRGIIAEDWEDDAIRTFQTNLENLLMTKPEYQKKILAIDPWYRAGCKMVVLDELWNPILFDKIFLHSSDNAKIKLSDIIIKQKIEVIVIGNWTWADETVELLQNILVENEYLRSLWKLQDNIFIVNESWASVYSASKIAKEEFPDLDSLDRWTISIGRRYIDPLSELVKVPVESIWVGMYQHDLPIKKLEEKLWFVVEDVVNEVWINVNTASSYVLNHISGIDKRWAKKIYNNRPYKSRIHLKKQLSDKIFEQAAWFLRIPESPEILDNTDIHPEQYELAKYIIKNNITSRDFDSNKEKLVVLYNDVNRTTIDFILDAYSKIWKDPRVLSTHKKANKKMDIEEIKEWDILEWIVRNVVAFGAFVDVWLKNDWLVHISQLADAFVKDPMDFVEVWQKVKVKLTKIDKNTWKIQLSMKDL